ncbi:hypothetical protein P8452_13018 [Trifolium repens]|nr:hypothetical protein P8452_13018 [Trifolium repens]
MKISLITVTDVGWISNILYSISRKNMIFFKYVLLRAFQKTHCFLSHFLCTVSCVTDLGITVDIYKLWIVWDLSWSWEIPSWEQMLIRISTNNL